MRVSEARVRVLKLSELFFKSPPSNPPSPPFPSTCLPTTDRLSSLKTLTNHHTQEKSTSESLFYYSYNVRQDPDPLPELRARRREEHPEGGVQPILVSSLLPLPLPTTALLLPHPTCACFSYSSYAAFGASAFLLSVFMCDWKWVGQHIPLYNRYKGWTQSAQ